MWWFIAFVAILLFAVFPILPLLIINLIWPNANLSEATSGLAALPWLLFYTVPLSVLALIIWLIAFAISYWK